MVTSAGTTGDVTGTQREVATRRLESRNVRRRCDVEVDARSRYCSDEQMSGGSDCGVLSSVGSRLPRCAEFCAQLATARSCCDDSSRKRTMSSTSLPLDVGNEQPAICTYCSSVTSHIVNVASRFIRPFEIDCCKTHLGNSRSVAGKGTLFICRHLACRTRRWSSQSVPAYFMSLLLLLSVSSFGGIAVQAAPTERGSAAAVQRVFDGDPSQDKNFDGTTYLMQFGYLPWSDLETGALRTDDELRRAIRNFQRVAGLRQTGRMDPDTVEYMQKPRCGMADLLDVGRWNPDDNDEVVDGTGQHHQHEQHRHRQHHGEIRASGADGYRRPQEYAFGPSKWNRTALTFRIVNFTPDLSYQETRDAIHRALHLWSEASQLTFSEVQTGHADIVIQFAVGYHQDGYPFDGQGMVLAHAFFPGEDRGGDVHFDDDEIWTVYREDGVDLFMVAAHELGHALGLAHSTVPGSLMFPWHQGYSDSFRLHEDDLEAIQRLYGARSSSHGLRPPVAPPTTVPPTTTTTPVRRPHHRPTQPTRSEAEYPDWKHPEVDDSTPPDPCTTNFDAVSMIRGEIFAFKGKWFWRINEYGVMPGHPVETQRFWYGLPTDVKHIDAVYERSTDGYIVFFSGRQYWSFSGSERYPQGGRPLTDFGLPADVHRVDAVFNWAYNRRTYLIAGSMYWKLTEEQPHSVAIVEQHGYPRDMSMWSGIPLPVDSAFTHSDGRTYFFKGHHYYEFNNARMHVQRGYPRRIGPRWLNCSVSEHAHVKPTFRTQADRDLLSSSLASRNYPLSLFTAVLGLTFAAARRAAVRT